MSTQELVPVGYAQEAIAPFASFDIIGKPDWSKVLEQADALYDRLSEEDLELRLAAMQFPS